MKRLLGVSIAALFVFAPALANAADGDRTVEALDIVDDSDTEMVATTSYVMGAYNEVARGVNSLITDTAITTNGNYIDKGKTVAHNLTELDTAVKAVSDALDNVPDFSTKQDKSDSNVTAEALSTAGLTSQNLNTGTGVAANLIKVAQQNKGTMNLIDVTESARNAAGLTNFDLNTGLGVGANLIKVAENIKTVAGRVATNDEAIEAINNSDVMKSGITKAKVNQITTNAENIDAINDSDVMKSGITKAKADQIATNAEAIEAINNSAVMNSGITKAKADQIATNAAEIGAINNKVIKLVKTWGSNTPTQIKITDLPNFKEE